MLKKEVIISFALSLGFLFGSISCTKNNPADMEVANPNGAQAFVKQNYINFIEGSPARLIGFADGYCNENGFGTTWSKDNALFDNDEGMRLLLEVTDQPSRIKASSGDPYISAEMRSTIDFRYGFFGTYMKPSNVSGTASTFFLYADNPHDEIDIEFLGNDTTKVQFNFFKNGVGGNEYWYDLGFDASEDYHHYGIYWGENELCWYIDFTPVYRLVGKDTPSAKCKLICNHWAGDTRNAGIMTWMGHVDEDECPSFSCYKDIEIADLNGKQMEVLPKIKDYNICPDSSTLETKPVIFKSNNAYTIADETSTSAFDITYLKEDIDKDYRCIKLTVEGIEEMRYVQFKIKNLHTEDTYPALCRLTVDTSAGSTTSNKFVSVWKDGKTSGSAYLKNNSLEAHYEIQVNEEAIMTFRWYGEGANELTLMFDDFGACPTISGKGQRDGHIFISDFKFGGVQDFVPIDTSGYVDELYSPNGVPEDPEDQQAIIPNEYIKVTNVTFQENEYYHCTYSDDGILMEYNQPADGYQQTGYYSYNIFNSSKEVIFVIKNNNRKELQFQLKLKGSSNYLIENNVQILSDSSTGRVARWSSSSPGVPYLAVAAGRTCQFKFTLSETNTKSIAFCVSPAVASEGSLLVKGIYYMPVEA